LSEDGGPLKEDNIRKILSNPHLIEEEIKKIEKRTEQPQYEYRPEDIKVNIRLDESVPPTLFKPDPLIPNGYIANSLTIRAMRPDIFVLGESIDDLELLYKCPSCNHTSDQQFWTCCPYCGSAFKE